MGSKQFRVTIKSFLCEYAPRFVRASLNSEAFFAACKDGSVTVISQKDEGQYAAYALVCSASSHEKPTSVQTLCEWKPGWLLIGRRDGALDLVNWQDIDAPIHRDDLAPLPKEHIAPDARFPLDQATWPWAEGYTPRDADAITYMGWLNQELLAISFRRGGTFILKDLCEEPDNVPASFSAALAEAQHLPELDQLGCVVCVDKSMSSRPFCLLLSWSGSTWLGNRPLAPEKGAYVDVIPGRPWHPDQRPSILSDFALIRPRRQPGPKGFLTSNQCCRGVYVSTDLGVFMIELEENGQLNASPLFLPGLNGMPFAITGHTDQQEAQYLWVADASGDIHLFHHRGAMVWERLNVLHQATQALRAYMSWQADDDSFTVVQSLRDDRVCIAQFRPAPLQIKTLSARLKAWKRGELKNIELFFDFFTCTEVEGLFSCLADFVTSYPKRKGKKSLRSLRSPETILADFFQIARNHPEGKTALIEYLANPNHALGFATLQELRKTPDRAGKAVNFWTYTLMGIGLRLAPEKSDAYFLGLLRWLETLEEAFDPTKGERDHDRKKEAFDPPKRELDRKVAHRVSRNQELVRKWGIFGHTFRERLQTCRTLDILDVQESEKRHFIHMVYEGILLERKLDIEGRSHGRHERVIGKTALDIRTTRFGDRDLAAVSWSDHPFELWEILRDGASLRFLKHDNCPDKPLRTRAMAFCRLPSGATLLLTAPVVDARGSRAPRLAVWRLKSPDHDSLSLQKALVIKESKLGLGEAVSSILPLEPGYALLGLRGASAQSKFRLLHIHEDGSALTFDCYVPLRPNSGQEAELRGISPEGKAIAANPIWSLATCNAYPNHGEPWHVVIAGCDDGQVWRLRLPTLASLRPDGSKIQLPDEPLLLKRLGSPVRSLAHWMCADGVTERVYIGCADATIVGLQMIDAENDPAVVKTGDGPPLQAATLFASREEGMIVSLHPFYYQSGEADDDPMPVLLAVTDQGRAILFNNRLEAEPTPPGKEKEHTRRRIPGERLARFFFEADAVATALDPSGAIGDTHNGRLVCATSEGRLGLVRLHCPYHTQGRKKLFASAQQKWQAMVKKGGKHALGQAEIALASAHAPSLFLTRYLIELDKSRAFPGFEELRAEMGLADIADLREWLPMHLRPLLDLDRCWRDQEVKAIQEKRFLARALRHARDLEDRRLYEEIIMTALKRANQRLFQVSELFIRVLDEPGLIKSVEKEQKIYFCLLEDIHQTGSLWRGQPDNLDSKVNMTTVKNMMDGDVLWKAAVHSRARDRNGNREPTADTGQQRFSELFSEILKKRIEQLHQFMVKGDPLLALETLRACNFSLLRACKRISEARMAEGQRYELPWRGFKAFFDTVGDYAGRAIFSEGLSNVALAHEIARSYALGVFASPSASIHLANSLSEANLPQDIVTRVERQFMLLKRIGIRETDAKHAETLFSMALNRRLKEGLTFLNPAFRDLLKFRKPPITRNIEKFLDQERQAIEDRVGVENCQAIRLFEPYDDIARSLSILIEQLGSDPRYINLTAAKKIVKKIEAGGQGDFPYKHSQLFWQEAVGRFQEIIDHSGIIVDRRPSVRIRPQETLVSTMVEAWAEETLANLEKARQEHRIFQPEYALWKQLLSDLRAVASQFRGSSAVQQNLVVGVLSHNLLETLDEHVLELDEIAQSLHPFLGRLPDEKLQALARANLSRREEFALYVRSRSRHAKSVPKNLRALQGILKSHLLGKGDYHYKIMQLIEDIFKDSVDVKIKKKRSLDLDEKEYQFLRLTLKELQDNHIHHGYPGQKPVISTSEKARSNVRSYNMKFYMKAPDHRDDQRKFTQRLDELVRFKLQEPIDPLPDRKIASHGLGLYLANLAASVIGWRLRIDGFKEEPVISKRKASSIFSIRFVLEKIDDAKPERTAQ